MEQWKPIKNYEGFYEISNTGKIKSLVNRYKTKQNAELLPYVDKKGYHRITLSKPTKGRFLVHRLVAEHFLDTVEGCDIVNHKDNNPSNNNFTISLDKERGELETDNKTNNDSNNIDNDMVASDYLEKIKKRLGKDNPTKVEVVREIKEMKKQDDELTDVMKTRILNLV